MQRLADHGLCFVCGPDNPNSIGIEWYLRDDGLVYGEVTLTTKQQGPPDHAHGGALAALLDEAMGAAVWRSGKKVAVVNLNIQYQHPVPLGMKISVAGRVSGQEGRKIHAQGEIRLADGTSAVTGTGIFVEAPDLFEDPTRFTFG